MGGVKSVACNELAKEIWAFCIERNIWLSAVHLPGVQNVVADRLSREFNEQVEWQLDKQVFARICNKFGMPEIDLFASRLNAQLPRFVSWHPDPDAEAIDALAYYWGDKFFYAFPPFCLVGQCIQKVLVDRAEGLMILPVWPTQPWYSMLLQLLTREPVILPKSKHLLINAMTGETHPMTNLKLMCCSVSGRALSCGSRAAWGTTPSTSFLARGGTAQRDSTTLHTEDGYIFARNGTLIPFTRL